MYIIPGKEGPDTAVTLEFKLVPLAIKSENQ